jgi:hypothetical protein
MCVDFSGQKISCLLSGHALSKVWEKEAGQEKISQDYWNVSGKKPFTRTNHSVSVFFNFFNFYTDVVHH